MFYPFQLHQYYLKIQTFVHILMLSYRLLEDQRSSFFFRTTLGFYKKKDSGGHPHTGQMLTSNWAVCACWDYGFFLILPENQHYI